jgi:hypothetical protein
MIGTVLILMVVLVLILIVVFCLLTVRYINKRRCKQETKTDLWLMIGVGIPLGIALLITTIIFIIFITRYIRCYYLLQRYKKQIADRRKLFLERMDLLLYINAKRLEKVKDKLSLEEVYLQTSRSELTKEEEMELVKLASEKRDKMRLKLDDLKQKLASGSLTEEEIVDLKNIEIIVEGEKTKPTIIKSYRSEVEPTEVLKLDLVTIFEDEPFSEVVKLLEDKPVYSNDYKVSDLIEEIKVDKYIGYITSREDDDEYLDDYIISLFKGNDQEKIIKYEIFKSLSLNEIGYEKNDKSSLKSLIQNFESINTI